MATSQTYTQRLITVTFTLNPAKPPFQESGTNTLTLKNLQVQAQLTKMATPGLGHASVIIYGMTLSQMNQLSTWGMPFQASTGNTITVMAGTISDQNLPIAFYGSVWNAWIDTASAPNVAFRVEAQTLGTESVIAIPSTSVKGSSSVATLMQTIVKNMQGWTFENNNVNATISNPYFYGSSRVQLQAIADAAGCDLIVDDVAKIIAITQKDQPRKMSVIKISPQSGMIGYPTFTQFGLMIRTIYNPNIRQGSPIQVSSQIINQALGAGTVTPSTVNYRVYSLDHDLAARLPRGNWQTTIGAWNPVNPMPAANI